VIRHLANNNATLYIDGFTEKEFAHSNIQHCTVNNIPFPQLNGLVLPVLGIDEQGQVKQYYPIGKTTLTKDMISELPSNCIIYTGTASDYLRKLCEKTDRKLVILFERDDVAVANSIPTAEATLQIAMEQTNKTIHGSTVLITGFGRVGMTMARMFFQMGANVIVAARKLADFARIKEMQMRPVHIHHLHEVILECDICINTIPYPILTADLIRSMKKSTLIIDVASAPGGTDFEAAENNGVNAIHALGLPGKVAPITAGDIIASTITEHLIMNN